MMYEYSYFRCVVRYCLTNWLLPQNASTVGQSVSQAPRARRDFFANTRDFALSRSHFDPFLYKFRAINVIGIQHKTLEAHRRNDDRTANFGQLSPGQRQNKTNFLQGLHCKSGARTPANSSRAVSWRPEGLKSFYGNCHLCILKERLRL